MTWLSILVPVYNVHPYLTECLESILSQTDQDIEVLALDDRSTDGSWDLLQQLGQRWPGRLKLLQHERNAGLSAARNTMIEAATGDYLWFVDSDDKLLPGAVHALAQIVQGCQPDIVLCDFSMWRETTQLKHRLRGEAHRRSFKGPAEQCIHDRSKLLAGLLSTGKMHAWSKISKRSLWNSSLRFPHGRYFEDSMCMPLLALRCQSFYYCPEPWIAYRQRSSSILGSLNTQKIQDLSASLRDFSQALSHDALSADPSLKEPLATQCARNLLGAIRFVNRQKGSLDQAQILRLEEQFFSDFEQSSPYSIRELVKIHIRHGHFIRAWKLYAGTHGKAG